MKLMPHAWLSLTFQLEYNLGWLQGLFWSGHALNKHHLCDQDWTWWLLCEHWVSAGRILCCDVSTQVARFSLKVLFCVAWRQNLWHEAITCCMHILNYMCNEAGFHPIQSVGSQSRRLEVTLNYNNNILHKLTRYCEAWCGWSSQISHAIAPPPETGLASIWACPGDCYKKVI